ncbi:MAG TPA: hypothetical protein VGB04_10655 [Allosphingosinicella sp.]|jgi:hypothetical protein
MAEEQKRGPPVYPPSAVHMARSAVSNQMHLSAMADRKASILLGAAFVIFTIAAGHSDGRGAPLPLLIMGGTAFLSAFVVDALV